MMSHRYAWDCVKSPLLICVVHSNLKNNVLLCLFLFKMYFLCLFLFRMYFNGCGFVSQTALETTYESDRCLAIQVLHHKRSFFSIDFLKSLPSVESSTCNLIFFQHSSASCLVGDFHCRSPQNQLWCVALDAHLPVVSGRWMHSSCRAASFL